MPPRATLENQPRKLPSQRRSTETVQAIYQATIQVLVEHGLQQLTTTRVAERAGASVGTLYQYFPNKRALLAAVLERHLSEIVGVVEDICHTHQGDTVRGMMTALCGAFIDAKVRRLDQSRALQATISEAGGEALVQNANERGRQAIAAMISTAKDVSLEDCELPALVLSTAIVGPLHAVLERGGAAREIAVLRAHLTELCIGYLEAIARPARLAPRRERRTTR
jgi:AcrR family transcriptional regulator